MMVRNRVVEYALGFIAAYVIGDYFINAIVFSEILNGLFLGWFVASLMIFGRQIMLIVVHQQRYSPRAQFMLGLSAFVLAMALIRTSSVIFRSLGIMGIGTMWVTGMHISDFAEYLAIIGGTLMTTTPGFADRELGRRDRRTLAVCFVIGLAIAIGAIYVQRFNLLAGLGQ